MHEIFAPEDLTAWIRSPEQTFELDVRGKAGLFSYKLIISYNPEIKKQRIEIEQLMVDGKPLLEFKRGKVQLYHDNHEPGPKYSFDWGVSAMAPSFPEMIIDSLPGSKNGSRKFSSLVSNQRLCPRRPVKSQAG